MREMQSVGIRDFRANLHKYTVENQDPIAVTSHGRHIGYYIPAKPSPKEADFEALRTASRLLEAMLKKSGVTEDEIVAEFDVLRKQERQQKPQP